MFASRGGTPSGRGRSWVPLRVVGASLALASLALPVTADAASDDEAYPPDQIVHLVSPFGCDPTSISGEIGVVLPGSLVDVEVRVLDGAVIGRTSTRADGNGLADYTVSIEAGRYGAASVVAAGLDTVFGPFASPVPVEIQPCREPDDGSTEGLVGRLADAGANGLDGTLRVAGVTVAVGAVMLAAGRRRQQIPSSTWRSNAGFGGRDDDGGSDVADPGGR